MSGLSDSDQENPSADPVKALAEALGFSPIAHQLLALQADICRTDAPSDFDARGFYNNHVGLVSGVTPPTSGEEAGNIVRAAIAATNYLAGGGAAGYLALLDLLMIAFRGDYFHADTMVRKQVLASEENL